MIVGEKECLFVVTVVSAAKVNSQKCRVERAKLETLSPSFQKEAFKGK
jgi:hypothetical protein